MAKNEIPPEIADRIQQYLYDDYLENMRIRRILNLIGFGIFVAIVIIFIVQSF